MMLRIQHFVIPLTLAGASFLPSKPTKDFDMKTLLMIIAFGAFTWSSNAQSCGRRVVHHRSRITHHTIARAAKVQEPILLNDDVTTRPEAPCVVYRKHNIVVTECPGVFYDNSNIEVNGEGTYMGNYPEAVPPKVNLDNQVNYQVAPQHNVIENDRGRVAPADGNTCVGCQSH